MSNTLSTSHTAPMLYLWCLCLGSKTFQRGRRSGHHRGEGGLVARRQLSGIVLRGGVVGRRPSATVEPALPHTTTRTLSPAQIFRPTEMTSDHNQSVRGFG